MRKRGEVPAKNERVKWVGWEEEGGRREKGGREVELERVFEVWLEIRREGARLKDRG